ncbi:multidrug resistance protein, MATE family, partial [Tremellales sp. Uapishka_1]
MSNFPHSSLVSSSLSTSPYGMLHLIPFTMSRTSYDSVLIDTVAIQSNLENLINRSKTHPHPHRLSFAESERPNPPSPTIPPSPREPTSAPPPLPTPHGHNRRGSNFLPVPAIGVIPESISDDGAAILLGDDEESDGNERSGLLGRQSRSSRRKSYGTGTISKPLSSAMQKTSSEGAVGRGGNSRSRSKARSPPRQVIRPRRSRMSTGQADADLSTSFSTEDTTPPSSPDTLRGRGHVPRALSTASRTSRQSDLTPSRARRFSIANDSSGEETDLVRGLSVTGGGALFGAGRPGRGQGNAVMDLDPAQELDAEDLELPLGNDGREVRIWHEALKQEMRLLLKSTIPILFTQFAEWSLVLASVVSIGHLGTTDLAASSLANMTASVSCFSILQGLATALDTLLPAAWTSSDPSRVEPEVARQAQRYLRYLSIGMPGYAGNIIVKKYLQCQNLMKIPTYTLFIVAPTNLLLNYLLVWGPAPVRLGFVGGALATAISYNLAFLISLGYALFIGSREAFHPLEFKHAFSKLGTVTSLGLAGTIMLSSEWWAWEACALAASLLGPTSLAAQSVLLSTCSTFYQIPASLGIASAVRVGNLLGAGRGWEAKWASRASIVASAVCAILSSVVLILAKNQWGYLFNNDPEVVALVAAIMPYVSLFQIADATCATTGSILRSVGLHATGAMINLTSYYIIGLPFGIWLTFKPEFGLGLIGIWLGLSVALIYGSVVSLILVWRTNWERAVERVRERLGLPNTGEERDGKWDAEGLPAVEQDS